MKLSALLLQARATMFIPRFMGYNPENVDKYKILLPDSVVGTVQGLMSPYGPLATELGDNSPWQLSRGSERIVFLPNRLDFIKSEPMDSETKEKDFLMSASDIFRNILKLESVNANRLAYSPEIALDGDVETCNEFWKSLFHINVFDGVSSQDNNVRIHFPVERDLNVKQILVNHVVEFCIGMKSKEQARIPVIISKFDINTMVSKDTFDALNVYSFFKQVFQWKNSLLKLYI